MQQPKPTAQKLYQLFIRAQPIMRASWGNKQAEAEAIHLANLVIDLLERELVAQCLFGLIWALEHPTELSECVLVSHSLDYDKRVLDATPGWRLHALVCKLWRWPDLTSDREFCTDTARCMVQQPNYFVACINPQHYLRHGKVKLPWDKLLPKSVESPSPMEQSLDNDLFPSSIWNYWETAHQLQDKMLTDTGPGSQVFLECEESANTEMLYELSPEVAYYSDFPKQALEKMDTHDSSTLITAPVTREVSAVPYGLISPMLLEVTDVSQSRKRRRSESNSHADDDVFTRDRKLRAL